MNSPGRKDHKDTNWYDSLHCNYQLGFHIDATATDIFFTCVKTECQAWAKRRSSCSVTFIPAKLGLLFLGNIPPHQPFPQEQCHAHTQFGCRHEKQGIIHYILNLSGRNWSGCWRNFTANSLSKLNYGYHHSSKRTHAHPQGPTGISRMTIAYFPLSLPNSICEASA